MVMNQTPTTRFVFSARTTWGRPTTRMLESSVAMKMPTVVTVRTTHLYSKDKPPGYQAFPSLRLARYKTPPRNEPRCSELGRYTETRPEHALNRDQEREFHMMPSSRLRDASSTLFRKMLIRLFCAKNR